MKSRTESKDRLTRMIEAQSEIERGRGEMRPLMNVIIHLECGCRVPIGSDPSIAPREGYPVWCFTHDATVSVKRVEYTK